MAARNNIFKFHPVKVIVFNDRVLAKAYTFMDPTVLKYVDDNLMSYK